MGTIFEIIITLLISFLIIGVIWLLYGRLVTPIKAGKGEELYFVVYVNGSSPDLSRTAKGILWLLNSGRIKTDIIIADGGMDEESRKMAELLTHSYSEIRLCYLSELESILASKRRKNA